MKNLIRSFLINVISLWLVALFFSGMSFARGYETLLFAGLVLGLVNLFVKPIINILLLPLNLLTLGTMRWVVNVITLYLVTRIVPDFTITLFSFPGLTSNGFTLPSFTIGGFFALIVTSFVLSLISSFLFWLVK